MAVRLTVLFPRLESISTEEFHKHWNEEHASIFLSVPIVRSNLTRYNQFHVNAEATSVLASAGVPTAPFDGGAEFWGDSVEKVMAVFQDPEYLSVVVPDELKFIDKSKAVMMIGHGETKWGGSKPT